MLEYPISVSLLVTVHVWSLFLLGNLLLFLYFTEYPGSQLAKISHRQQFQLEIELSLGMNSMRGWQRESPHLQFFKAFGSLP